MILKAKYLKPRELFASRGKHKTEDKAINIDGLKVFTESLELNLVEVLIKDSLAMHYRTSER